MTGDPVQLSTVSIRTKALVSLTSRKPIMDRQIIMRVSTVSATVCYALSVTVSRTAMNLSNSNTQLLKKFSRAWWNRACLTHEERFSQRSCVGEAWFCTIEPRSWMWMFEDDCFFWSDCLCPEINVEVDFSKLKHKFPAKIIVFETSHICSGQKIQNSKWKAESNGVDQKCFWDQEPEFNRGLSRWPEVPSCLDFVFTLTTPIWAP